MCLQFTNNSLCIAYNVIHGGIYMIIKGDKMKIKWIEFENLETGLKIERIDFFEDVTLLVGLSGVGKTQILNAVSYSLALAMRHIVLRPYSATLGIDINGEIYEWSYKIEANPNDDIIVENGYEYIITNEKLIKNGNMVFERDTNSVNVAGYNSVPQPKKDESLLLQYSDDDEFEPLISGLRKLYSIEMELEVRGGINSESFNTLKTRVNNSIKKNESVDFRSFSHLPVMLKIYIAKRYYPELYFKIFDVVKELFMEVEEFDVEEDVAREMYLLCMTVYGKKLMQHDISNGMLKTIYYIVELFTMSENSLVLIDEFENGLGVNCIDLLSEFLLTERKDLQFIITSHHPKIINYIPKEKWKIIERNIGTVTNANSNEYGIGNSQHDAYFNLINRWEFEGKI